MSPRVFSFVFLLNNSNRFYHDILDGKKLLTRTIRRMTHERCLIPSPQYWTPPININLGLAGYLHDFTYITTEWSLESGCLTWTAHGSVWCFSALWGDVSWGCLGHVCSIAQAILCPPGVLNQGKMPEIIQRLIASLKMMLKPMALGWKIKIYGKSLCPEVLAISGWHHELEEVGQCLKNEGYNYRWQQHEIMLDQASWYFAKDPSELSVTYDFSVAYWEFCSATLFYACATTEWLPLSWSCCIFSHFQESEMFPLFSHGFLDVLVVVFVINVMSFSTM